MAWKLGEEDANYEHSFYIEPDGSVSGLGRDLDGEIITQALKQDPRLHPDPQEGWHFGSGTPREPQGDNVPRVPFHNYDEPQAGKPWKGLVMKDGTRYHWGVDEDLSPHHSDALWGRKKIISENTVSASAE
jgi:hypothetical protein